MPTGRVKVYHQDRKYGFITADNGRELFVSDEHVEGDGLRSGDEVSYELGESQPGGGPSAEQVKVTKAAPPDNPVGRTMTAPPSWDELEELERARRAARRRRR